MKAGVKKQASRLNIGWEWVGFWGWSYVGEGLSTGEKSTSTKGEVGPLLSLLRKKVCSVELSLPSKLKFIFSLSINKLPITKINILKFGPMSSTASLKVYK
jgi:hypothetical protein